MFVLNPDPYSLPCYRIGPFQTKDLSFNHCLQDSDEIDDYLNERFQGKDYQFTQNARKAINIALSHYGLQRDDVVTILTTTENFYISGCVTREIEKFCEWSRKLTDKTKVIFVNHEFGYPYNNIQKLKQYNLPIIEDCANSFFSRDHRNEIGHTGDFVVYSLPKMFPIQIGGILVSNLQSKLNIDDQVEYETLKYIKKVLSYHIAFKDEIIKKRIHNYNFLKSKFAELDLFERFDLDEYIIPGVFMFRNNSQNLNLPELKTFLYAHGIQCSVFYGEEAFFIPVHQALSEQDMLYFYEVVKSFINR
ncbi:MAG TPA: DegT/DnrJ/EryC1/StrS family aminotransferase [Bacteroidales bacterium]|nr:DegT/DnrJ/EryC1/StrS family aminotransferase [Bacteroidales bacterium]